MHRDWSNAEYGIAAALAHDDKRWDHYLLKSDRDVVLYDANGYRYNPERKVHYGHYQHEDGQKMWNKIEAALARVVNEDQIVSVE